MKKRLKILIYPKFQLELVFANVALMAAALFFVGVQMSRSFQGLKDMGMTAKIPPEHAYFKFLDWQITQMWSYLAIAFAVSVVVSGVVTLVISNKLAGPIVRLRRYFKRVIKNGQVQEKVVFRKGDFFPDLPETINRALKAVESSKKKSKSGDSKAA